MQPYIAKLKTFVRRPLPHDTLLRWLVVVLPLRNHIEARCPWSHSTIRAKRRSCEGRKQGTGEAAAMAPPHSLLETAPTGTGEVPAMARIELWVVSANKKLRQNSRPPIPTLPPLAVRYPCLEVTRRLLLELRSALAALLSRCTHLVTPPPLPV